MILDILDEVKSAAEKDRTLAKEHGNYNAAVYFQGKIVACNEIKEEIKEAIKKVIINGSV